MTIVLDDGKPLDHIFTAYDDVLFFSLPAVRTQSDENRYTVIPYAKSIQFSRQGLQYFRCMGIPRGITDDDDDVLLRRHYL